MHPPASIVIDVILGWDKDRLCYVVGKRGAISWSSAKRVFKVGFVGKDWSDCCLFISSWQWARLNITDSEMESVPNQEL